MIKEGLYLDEVTAVAVLSGCALMGFRGLLEGKSVHRFVAKNGWQLKVQLGPILVDMYAKCGSISSALQVFDLMQERNVMTWTLLICGMAQLGYGTEALSLFETMQKERVRPNEVTFTGIIHACADARLVAAGRRFFEMIEECGLGPRIQHYGFMVDLYGKVGMVEEAYDVTRTMKLKPNVIVWTSFFSACKERRKVEMAKRVIEQVLSDVKPENDDGVYSLISYMYALDRNWNDAERVWKLILRDHPT